MTKRVIWWIRRDLRLTDNVALHTALASAAEVIPVFVLDDRLLNAPRLRGPRTAWMLDGLRALDSDLRADGARLIVRRGDPAGMLIRMCQETGAEEVYFNRDYGPFATQRDKAVGRALREAGYTVRSFKDLVIHEVDEIAAKGGKSYEVYTPFFRAWDALPKPAPLPAPDRIDRLAAPTDLASIPVPTASELGADPAPQPIAPPGEGAALRRLAAFLDGAIAAYQDLRNRLDIDGTSVLSPYLRWGMISPRTCYQSAIEALARATDEGARAGIGHWIKELAWREFNYYVLTNNPHIVSRSFRAVYDRLAWEDDPAWLQAWKDGKTGYPVVDAAMRQLRATGWMHNRARMITASFLCKDLLIDWRRGEAYFMQRLIDGDVANNVGGWQWTAGTGTDAAPYFRIFNPVKQSEQHDPTGAYIRRWLPELAHVPDSYIHAPYRMPHDAQVRSGCLIGRDYPAPIVDHEAQRERALALYGAARS
jgi:deoxyribodipyrimidine photo-lyase